MMKPSNSKLLSGDGISQDEYGELYGGYINKIRGKNLLKLFDDGRNKLTGILETLDDKQSLFRYADGKWSVKEILGHLTDTERIMGYRALCIARNDMTDLPGYDHDTYVAASNFDERSLYDLLEDYAIVRKSTVSLFQSFRNEMLLRKGTVNENPFSVRAIGYVIAGHEMYHIEILKDKYLQGIGL